MNDLLDFMLSLTPKLDPKISNLNSFVNSSSGNLKATPLSLNAERGTIIEEKPKFIVDNLKVSHDPRAIIPNCNY